MKLRNKKTGEIVDYISFEKGGGQISMYVFDTNTHYYYNSLADLNEEWEDYEEPKDNWLTKNLKKQVLLKKVDELLENKEPRDVYFIDSDGNIVKSELEDGKIITLKKQAIGNYFETKEEAEKAVERLKAIKRLKDKGLKFHLGKYENKYVAIEANWGVLNGDFSDVFILFGGEE